MANVVDKNRDLRNSVFSRVTTLLAAPPSPATAFTVYNEAQLRQAAAGTLKPVHPSVFVVDKPIRPTTTTLPLVVVETEITSYPFELGNIAGKQFRVWLHCFGRQRNEASFLASLFQESFRPLALYNYADITNPVLVETALLATTIDIAQGTQLPDAWREQGAFDYWYTVSIRGTTRIM